MAKFAELDLDRFNVWASSRPATVRALIARLPPDRLYLMKSTRQRVTVFSYGEDGTVAVEVREKGNIQRVEHQVFGVRPHDLEECELPGGAATVTYLKR